MKKLILSLAFAFLFCLSMSQNALACSCMPPADAPLKKQVADARENAAAVFTAQVISVGDPDPAKFIDRQVKVKITKTYKGTATGEIVIVTGHDSAMCGYTFEVGKTYLIYADRQGDKLSVGLCSRTAPSTQAKKDIKVLKKFTKTS